MLSLVSHALRLAPDVFISVLAWDRVHGEFPLILVILYDIACSPMSSYFAASSSEIKALSMSLLLLYEYIQGL